MGKSIILTTTYEINNINDLCENSEIVHISNIMENTNYEGDIIIKGLNKIKILEISGFTYYDGNIIISNNNILEKIIIKGGSAKSINISNNPVLKNIEFSLLEEYFEQSKIFSVEKNNLTIQDNNIKLSIQLSECEKYFYFGGNNNYNFNIINNSPEQLHNFIEGLDWGESSKILIPIIKSFIYNSKIDKINLLYLYDLYSGGAGSGGFKDNDSDWYAGVFELLLEVEKLINNGKYNSFQPELIDEYPFEYWKKSKGIPSFMLKHSGYKSPLKSEKIGQLEIYTKHNNKIFRYGDIIDLCDSETFSILSKNEIITKDKNNIYYHGEVIIGADLSTFKIVSNNEKILKDKNYIYYCEDIISGADPLTLEILSNDENTFKDKNKVYYEDYSIKKVDMGSFEVFHENEEFSRDKNNVYHMGNIVKRVDSKSFQLMVDDIRYFKDKNCVYYNHQYLLGVKSENFKLFSKIGDKVLFTDGVKVFLNGGDVTDKYIDLLNK